jgi:hypothetical protein
VTQEFQISITPVGSDTYWLRTEVVAPGVPLAEAQITWPIEDWLAQADALLRDPLHDLLANPTAAIGSNTPWTQLGQALYDGIFQGRLRDSWLAALGVAQNRRQPLRLRLGFKDSRVQRLPWELLYGDDRPLATGLDVTLCRYYQGQAIADLATMPPLATAQVPIRVLVVVSAPNDQERLALRQEVQALAESLDAPQIETCPLTLDLTILEQPGRPELVQALEQGNFQMFHYAGHSDTGDTGGDLYLVNRQTGLSDWLSGADLAGLLVNNGIRLAVFNSCRGGYTPQDDAQAGWRDQNLVQALVHRGVPAVIAMADRISDDVALTFTQLLYRNLHQGHPIDLCLSRVRQGLRSAYGGQPVWTLPLLYLRPDFDGYLYRGDRPLATEGIASGLVDDDLTEVALLLSDYSSDPDISTLAAEVFAPASAAILPADAIPPSDPAPPLDLALPADLPRPALYSWLQDFDGAEPATADGAAVVNLVQQLSRSAIDADHLSVPTADLPPPSPPVLPEVSPVSDPSPAMAVPQRFSPWLPLPLLWVGLGLMGLGALLGLALTTLSSPDSPPNSALGPAVQRELAPASGALGTQSGGTSGSSNLLEPTLQAINLGNIETARSLMEQMLDRGDLTTAAAAVATLPARQLDQPDLAYVRGRLAWQQMATGQGAEATAFDARRAWSEATGGRPDFVDAWVALGFAHYLLADHSEAIAAWEQAIALDRRQQRDINPDLPRVANPFATNAHAGLAMAYQQVSKIAIQPIEQAQLQQQAQGHLSTALTLDPSLVNVNTLGLQWLWLPAPLINDWRATLGQL